MLYPTFYHGLFVTHLYVFNFGASWCIWFFGCVGVILWVCITRKHASFYTSVYVRHNYYHRANHDRTKFFGVNHYLRRKWNSFRSMNKQWIIDKDKMLQPNYNYIKSPTRPTIENKYSIYRWIGLGLFTVCIWNSRFHLDTKLMVCTLIKHGSHFKEMAKKRQIADCVGVVINKCHVDLR